MDGVVRAGVERVAFWLGWLNWHGGYSRQIVKTAATTNSHLVHRTVHGILRYGYAVHLWYGLYVVSRGLRNVHR